MEFVCIEAGTFMEMNEALEAIARRVHETCGGSTRGMDEWVDNQEACTLMDVPPRKMLQLRRSGSIPYSYIDRKVLQTAGYHPLYGGGNSSGDTPKSNDMIQSMLTKESPEIIRFFRNIESLSEILDTQAEKMRPVLNGERYMTDSELAGHLKLTRRTLAEYRITGKLPYYKVGGKLLYKEKDILVLLERNRMEAFDYR